VTGTGRVSIGFKTSPQGVDWQALDELWAAAGELDVFESGWLNDHLSDPTRERGGSSWEPLTLGAMLAHRVPGKSIGVAVLSNTFRHPSILAKASTALDIVTGGRFVVGLGAGWHEGEHEAFGIPLPPVGERISRLESAVKVLRALGSDEARQEPGVTLEDPFYPLRDAVNLPAAVTPGGPSIWLGGQKPRGLRLAARHADGWILPAGPDGILEFRERRDALLREMEVAGRDPARFAFAAQLRGGSSSAERAAALAAGVDFIRAGATHVIIATPAQSGPDNLRAVAHEVAEPVREATG
jgi:alkanesulfonate monooxygenase SsuD/methylene tetrahydromethanopterin reductase-like flavin-dependent oxidoreductase (luciferase family)